jgi:hypothetical protein
MTRWICRRWSALPDVLEQHAEQAGREQAA